jgi:hypothetical protein
MEKRRKQKERRETPASLNSRTSHNSHGHDEKE